MAIIFEEAFKDSRDLAKIGQIHHISALLDGRVIVSPKNFP
jgi:hypothetical protein